ncbi:MAG: leucine-rich repeat protein [Clostridia bacterium]|nr:leucine-rich repeat protein [Clostridia bacterium]
MDNTRELLERYSSLEVADDIPTEGRLTWEQIHSTIGNGAWIRMIGVASVFGGTSKAFAYLYDSDGTLSHASDTWVDGRYVDRYEKYLEGETFDKHPESSIILLDVTVPIISYDRNYNYSTKKYEYSNVAVTEEIKNVRYSYDKTSKTWKADSYYNTVSEITNQGLIDKKYLDNLLLTYEEVVALKVDRNTNEAPQKGYLYDASAKPGTPFNEFIPSVTTTTITTTTTTSTTTTTNLKPTTSTTTSATTIPTTTKPLTSTTVTTTVTSTLTTTTITTTSKYQGFYYKKINNGVEITGLDETITGDVIIPEEIDGLPVIRIGEFASFHKEENISDYMPSNDGILRVYDIGSGYTLVQRDNLTSVSIPSSVKEIGNSAFWGCKKIKQINFFSGLERIEFCAFMGTGITELKLPDSVKYIGASAFYGCQDLSKVTLPKNLEFLGMCNFILSKLDSNISTGNFIVDGWYIKYKAGNDSYPKVLSIPEGTIGIAEQSYSYINEKENDTTKIIIPSSLKIISDNSFRYYLGLEEFEVADNNPYFFEEKGVLYNKTKTKIIRFPAASPMLDYVFPNTITSTSPWAFCCCQHLNSVKMNNELSELGGAAFKGCKNLSSVEFSNAIRNLNSCEYLNVGGAQGNIDIEGTFQECDSLDHITIPKNIDYIGDATFAFCKNLKKVTVKNPCCEIVNSYDYEATFTNGLYDDNFKEVDIIELYGYKDSTLQAYAQKYNKKFVAINDSLLLGDVNNDGTVDGSDATWVLREYGNVLAGKEAQFTPEQFEAGDVDRNGTIDGSDATLILKFYGEAGMAVEISYGGMELWMNNNFWKTRNL